MTVLNIVALALLIVVGSGAHWVYLWVTRKLSKLMAHPERLAFVFTTVLGAALCYPFLVPQDTVIEIIVWVAYLGLAGIGAWHIYDVFTRIKLSFRIES
jgi:hypothetical protein